MLRSAREWSDMGFRIKTGVHSFYSGAGGVPLFSHKQVTPWENIPSYQSASGKFIRVDGALYRRV